SLFLYSLSSSLGKFHSIEHMAPVVQLCRIMRPDDANIVGNVHGGTILKMIEEAGCIIGTRHCNTQAGDRCVAALARVERTDFLHPMFIGEVAHVSAEITYTSKHSVEVQVNVLSENILTEGIALSHTGFVCLNTKFCQQHKWKMKRFPIIVPKTCISFSGSKKVTNKATLWYVPLSLRNVDKIIEVPPIEYSNPDQEELGKKRYEAQKFERMETKERNGEVITPVSLPEPYTVGFSQSSLIHLIGPSDCTLHGFVHGGKEVFSFSCCAFQSFQKAQQLSASNESQLHEPSSTSQQCNRKSTIDVCRVFLEIMPCAEDLWRKKAKATKCFFYFYFIYFYFFYFFYFYFFFIYFYFYFIYFYFFYFFYFYFYFFYFYFYFIYFFYFYFIYFYFYFFYFFYFYFIYFFYFFYFYFIYFIYFFYFYFFYFFFIYFYFIYFFYFYFIYFYFYFIYFFYFFYFFFIYFYFFFIYFYFYFIYFIYFFYFFYF
ncbi:hypothetical protein NFI96_011171, partial [Prochilodus magdalenae]